MEPKFWAVVLLFAVGGLAFGGGCALQTKSSRRTGWKEPATNLSKEELGELLQQFEDTYEATIREAAQQIVALQPDRRTRRLVLLWQMRLIPMARDVLNQDDAIHSLLDSWAMCVRVLNFFEKGDGRSLFGENQPIAEAAARRSLDDIERIAARILPPELLSRARPVIEDLARQFPLRGEFSGSTVRTAVQRPERNADVVTTILAVPMAPFRAFEGIDRGAAAIQGFTAVAARMTDTVNDLPETVRIQTELLLMEIEDLESVQATLASLTELAHSSARISAVAERLPEDLRREFSLAAEDLEQHQASFQHTLQEARIVADRTKETLTQAQSTAVSVERAATHTAVAGEAWTATFQAITEMVASFKEPGGRRAAKPDAPEPTASSPDPLPGAVHSEPATLPDGEQRGFDIYEYTQAAYALDQGAIQIQELIRELRQLAGSSELEGSLAQVEARARGIVGVSHTSALAIIDHLAWRGVQILVLFFAGLLGYTVLARFLSRGVNPALQQHPDSTE